MGKKDYILRSKAIKAVTGWETDPTDEELEMALSNVPSADVVEVTRCKDCEWFNACANGNAFKIWDTEDYCSYGEKKDGQ